ncbi:phage tail sheath protein [Brevibacillus sp. SYP-B805]|uniref:phage tail sheath subtilisin-like domain-containing protein n=1 Tax=Brevibacillus sp. SYP-B805 TaxID=1578199 RepID=UPI0013EC9D94|nr:phage tail sheath subtilisin-like domain-containing protein [Brevibacillus sp. SYP-B805]NGQ95500.1 phage tail sheath protein [Brevibacillus sp. SYP-B805]
MATGGRWDPTSLPTRPGLYINFVEAAAAQIKGGPRGIVAIPLKQYAGTATAKQFYTVETEKQANDLFGAANIQSVKLALQGGAKEVLVYTLPTIDGVDVTEDEAYAEAFEAFDARPFNVFVFDGEVSGQLDEAFAWVKRNRDEGKHFFVVFGGSATDDADPAIGNARSIMYADDYVINLIEGGKLGANTYTSAEYAAYIAGLVAGTPINRSITYAQVPLEDVSKRLTSSQIKSALEAGSLVLVHDGVKVKVEQGLTTSKKKIRTISARQAISTDITMTAADNYIGKLDNNADGQAALISAVKAYLERLENANVLADPVVTLDPQYESIGDSVYLLISYVEIDSMERIFLTINV